MELASSGLSVKQPLNRHDGGGVMTKINSQSQQTFIDGKNVNAMSRFIFPIKKLGGCHETISINGKLAIRVGVPVNCISVQQNTLRISYLQQ